MQAVDSKGQVIAPMEFLDYLTKILGCEFLSDLCFIEITEQEAANLLRADIEMFPFYEYQAAANYLCRNSVTYLNAMEARAAAVDCLRSKK